MWKCGTVFTTSNMYTWNINKCKALLRSVISYDDIDNAGRNTPLRPWEYFSCFNIRPRPCTWLLTFQPPNQGVKACIVCLERCSRDKDQQRKAKSYHSTTVGNIELVFKHPEYKIVLFCRMTLNMFLVCQQQPIGLSEYHNYRSSTDPLCYSLMRQDFLVDDFKYLWIQTESLTVSPAAILFVHRCWRVNL